MAYESELIEILKEGYGNDWESKTISAESINHLTKILELKLNLLVGNINNDEYFEKETEINKNRV